MQATGRRFCQSRHAAKAQNKRARNVKLYTEEGAEIRVKHLHAVQGRDKVYVYHRPSGARIEGIQRHDGRLVASRAAFEEIERLNAARTAPAPGTLGGVFDAYRATPHWRALQQRTRSDYEALFDWLAPERSKSLRHIPMHALTPEVIVSIRDRAHEMKGWRRANYVLSVLSVLCEWARSKRIIATNPCSGVARVAKPSGAKVVNRRWEQWEIDAVLDAARKDAPQLVLPILIARNTGMRQGDVLRLGLSAWDGCSFRWRANKNGAEQEMTPPPRDLVAALNVRQATAHGRKMCLNSRGDAWGEDGSGFRASFFKLIRRLEAEGKVRAGLTFHGLRHTVGVELAEANASEETIKAILGNVSNAAIRVYLRSARKSVAMQRAVSMLDARRCA
jgi:integrase